MSRILYALLARLISDLYGLAQRGNALFSEIDKFWKKDDYAKMFIILGKLDEVA